MNRSKKKNPVWDHFTMIKGEEKATCNLCNKRISTQNSNTTNVTSHLRTQHTPTWLSLKKQTGISASTAGGDGEEDELDVDEEGLGTQSPSQSPSPSPTPSSSGRPEGSRDSPSPGPFSPPASPAPGGSRTPQRQRQPPAAGRGQQSLDSYVPDSKSTERCHLAVAHYIVTCQRPLNTVEKDGFKYMLKTFKPGYKPLTRRALTDKYIPVLEGQVKSVLRKLLMDAESYALTSDNWTSSADVPFTSLTAHFIDKSWETLHAVTLRCRATHLQHTGLILKDFFLDELKHWGLDKSKVAAVTTDNAEDYRLALELLNLPHMRCLGHTVQNGVTDIFNLPVVKDAIAAVKILFNWISITGVWHAYEKFVVEQHGTKPLTLPSTSKTRWWTDLFQFDRVIECHSLMMSFAASYQRGKELRKIPGPTTMFVIREVVRTLQPIKEICTKLCADSYITASAVLPVVHLMEAGFVDDDDDPQIPLDAPDEDDGADEIDAEALKPAALRQYVVGKLKKRYCSDSESLDEDALNEMTPQAASQARIAHRCAVKTHRLLVKCSFLDPRYRRELLPGEESLAKDLLREEFSASLPDADHADDEENGDAATANTTRRRTEGLEGFFAKKRRLEDGAGPTDTARAPTMADKFSEELDRYADIPRVSMGIDVLAWWRERVDTYPNLQTLARKYLCVTASSTSSERLFSDGGNVITDTRTCLTDDHAEMLVFLSSNKKFLKTPL